MNKYKRVYVALLVCTLSVLLTVPALAATQLTCWYSNIDEVAYTPYDGSFCTYQLCTDSAFITKFTNALSNASAQWNVVLPISVGERSESYALNSVYGGTLSQLQSRFPTLTYGAGGLTYTDGTVVDKAKYNGSTKKIVKLDVGGKLCIVHYENGGLSANVYKTVATHEMGHLLGWKGHSTNTADVLYESATEKYTLTARDKNHLKQVYTLYYE